MSKLVRKINLAKWRKTNIASGDPICADAITGCMRTSDNSLSVWAIDSLDEIDQAAIAIAASQERLDTIDLIAFDQERISDLGIRIELTPGITAATALKESHRDLKDLTYNGLGELSEETRKILINDQRKRYTVGKLKALLSKALESGLINPDYLDDHIKTKLGI